MGEFMLLLEETDYKPYLISKDGQPIREVNDIKKRLYIKLRDEIEYLMGQASEPLGTFL
jgi:vacuolar-type H+-ATPase subunit C/Vma6